MNTPVSPLDKEQALLHRLRAYGKAALAYSGGVDSTYLADVAQEALDDGLLLLIADTPSIPRDELAFALRLARDRGWNTDVITPGEFEKPEFLENSSMRCYHCKKELFSHMRHRAEDLGILILLYGETAEDSRDTTRVGMRAARECNVLAPLAEEGFTKEDIRERSRARGLPTWNKASFACLASRVPTGTPLDAALLHNVEEAEKILKKAGFRQYRARHHGEICRIEVDSDEMDRFLDRDLRAEVVAALQGLGYRHITLDLAGYRTGSTAARPKENG